MDKRLTNWKRRLLDIGKRNRLINFKKSLASTLEIVPDDFYKLYNSFMDDGVFEFAKLFDDLEEFIDLEKEEYEGRLANALGKTVYYKERYDIEEINEIKKRFKPAKNRKYLYSTTIYGRMNNVLNNLRKKAKLYHEENGVNSLFLCFGFLKYVEDKQEFLAPLVLVPVEVYQTSITESFRIKPLDEDFVVNDNLIHKLKLDYKIDISLPSPDTSMKQYLEYVGSKVSKLKFEILNEIWLGLFAFSKIMMYQDIERNEDKIKSSEIVKTFCGLPSTLNSGIKTTKVNLDRAEALEEQNQVLSADSSQYKAIYYAKKGLSFVLQGPPGTGKSQTITNMLGELIAQGKTVLFVCEKRSALEVVYRNLKKCNLEDYALPLFDTKINKKEIVKSIYDNLDSIQNNRVELSDEAKKTINLDEEEMLKLAAYVREISKKIEPLNKSLSDITSVICSYSDLPDMEFEIDNPLAISEDELNDYLNKIEIFSNITAVLGPDPKSHPFYLFSKSTLNKTEAKEFKEIIAKARLSLSNFSTLLNEIRDRLKIELQDFESLNSVLEFIKSSANPMDVSSDLFKIKDLDILKKNLKQIQKLYEDIKSNKDYLMKKYRLAYLDLDVNSLVESMEQDFNTKLKRVFKYKKTDKLLESYLLTPYDLKYEEAYEDLLKLKAIKDGMIEIASKDGKLKEYFSDYYFGALTDFYSLNELITYLCNISNGLKYVKIDSFEEFLTLMKDPLNQSYALMSVKKIENMLNEVNDSVSGLAKYFDFDVKKENPLVLYQRLNVMYMYFDKVYEYMDFIKAYQMLDRKISSFKKECLNKNIKASDFKGAFLKHFYELVLEEYLLKNSKLDIYSKDYINYLIEDYQRNSEKLKEIAKIKIRTQVTDSWPQIDSLMGSNLEVKNLLAEANKKRKLKTLRMLFKDIPHILMDLKPIFMTSPLTVATYLDSDAFQFDCVIFDEASQVTTENAIGAMYRSKQIIIVGDNEQLPPTSFFDSAYDDEEEDPDDYDVYESILDEALTVLPKIMLKWHYRSKDESLIAFSNEQIYHSLTTFPSFSRNDSLGLIYNYAPDLYTHGKRINEKEAHRVLECVMDIAKNNPNKSLGVVTFNMAQQAYIERLIRKERIKNPIYEDFFSEDKLESFFVKNLETVQGDERDIIILSTTFGLDENGKLSLNFGPINKEGGYRRLNVAITRAKEKVILCTSLKPSDFNLERTTNKGVIMLHDYISFASSISNLAFKENEMDNGVVVAIENFLKSKGYQTVKNIGYSGYKIDLAVLNPNNPLEVLLGILTDQDNYQSLKTVKDRNYTIDNVLRGRGWRLLHIFCIPFIKNPSSYFNEIEHMLTSSDEKNIEAVEDVAIYSQASDDNNDLQLDSLFGEYPNVNEIINEYMNVNGSITEKIDLILDQVAPIKIDDLKRLILPLYQKGRLNETVSQLMDEDIKPLIKKRKYHKVIGFLLRPADLYGVSFRKYVPGMFYPKIDGIYVEELEDGFVQIIKHIKTTSKKFLYADLNELVGYPRGSSQTKIYFDRVIDILVDKGIILLAKDIIEYIEK